MKSDKPTLAELYYEGKKITGELVFSSKIVGVTAESSSGKNRQKMVKKLDIGDRLYLIPDRHHRHDPNAVTVLNQQEEDLGYLPAQTAADLQGELEEGEKFFAVVKEKTGGGFFKSTGVNINVYRVEQ